jgi:hypothetical protein
MWRRRRTKPTGRQAALGLLQDAMRRVEQEHAAAAEEPEPLTVVGIVLDRSDAPPLQEAEAWQAPLQQQQVQPQQVPRQQPHPREASTTGPGDAGR